jgi:hypothetical protein
MARVQGHRLQLRGQIGWGAGLSLAGLLLGFVAITNRWLGWNGGFDLVHANDERAYLTIAHAFPGLPDEAIADQHAQRWAVHWSIGGLADLFGTSPEVVYSWVAVLLAIAVCVILVAVLIRLEVSVAAAAIALGIVVLGPYAFRFYVFAPGYLADLVFYVALAAVLLGAVRRSLAIVLVALVVGIVARQTMLFVIPVVAVWIVLASDWRRSDGRRPWAAAAAALVLPAIAFALVKEGAADFAARGYSFSRLTILDTVMDLPGTASDLGNHLSHTAIVPIVVTCLLVATLTSLDLRRLGADFWGPLAIGVAIVFQTFALNPDPIAYDYSSTNEPRLASMALPALAVALAVARRNVEATSEAARENAPALLLIALPLLALASLHQKFTVISTGSAAATFATQVVVGGSLFAAIWIADRRQAVRRPAPG